MNKRSYEIWKIFRNAKSCRVLEVVLISFGHIRNNRKNKSNTSSEFLKELKNDLRSFSEGTKLPILDLQKRSLRFH